MADVYVFAITASKRKAQKLANRFGRKNLLYGAPIQLVSVKSLGKDSKLITLEGYVLSANERASKKRFPSFGDYLREARKGFPRFGDWIKQAANESSY